MRCRIEMIKCQLCELVVPIQLKNLFEITKPEEPSLEENIRTGLNEAQASEQLDYQIEMNILASKMIAKTNGSVDEEMIYLQKALDLQQSQTSVWACTNHEIFVALRVHDFTIIKCYQSSTVPDDITRVLRWLLENLLQLRNKMLQNLPFFYQRCAWFTVQDRSQVTATWQPDNEKLWHSLVQIQLRIALNLVLLAYKSELTQKDLSLSSLDEIGWDTTIGSDVKSLLQQALIAVNTIKSLARFIKLNNPYVGCEVELLRGHILMCMFLLNRDCWHEAWCAYSRAACIAAYVTGDTAMQHNAHLASAHLLHMVSLRADASGPADLSIPNNLIQQHICELQEAVFQFTDVSKRRLSNADRKDNQSKPIRTNTEQNKVKSPPNFRQLFLQFGKVHQFDLVAPLCLGAKITVYKTPLAQEMRNLNVSHPTELTCDPRENTNRVCQHYLSIFTHPEPDVAVNAMVTDERNRLTSQVCADIFAQYELILRKACLNIDYTRLLEHLGQKGTVLADPGGNYIEDFAPIISPVPSYSLDVLYWSQRLESLHEKALSWDLSQFSRLLSGLNVYELPLPTNVLGELYGTEENLANPSASTGRQSRTFARNSAGFPEVYGYQPILGQIADKQTKRPRVEQSKPIEKGSLLLQLIDDLLLGCTLATQRAHILITFKELRPKASPFFTSTLLVFPSRTDLFALINHFNGLYACIQSQAAEDSEPAGDLYLRGEQRTKVTSKRTEKISSNMISGALDSTNENELIAWLDDLRGVFRAASTIEFRPVASASSVCYQKVPLELTDEKDFSLDPSLSTLAQFANLIARNHFGGSCPKGNFYDWCLKLMRPDALATPVTAALTTTTTTTTPTTTTSMKRRQID
ncbi:hypothetical protein D915_007947 [Fasciola hepatica]|uniref:Uncharacterized protein n=1 Tax=Fasciola hepatica TaxID=6192 RepID=A0A4E0RV82_FASHE|nr:hypothetical protein D915_007947 [Fasciola hepatica]